MKILVTGAAGFIGFHLVQALVKNGLEVVGIDNINDYYDVNLKYARLALSGIELKQKASTPQTELAYHESTKYKNYRFLRLDITNFKLLEELFQNENFDGVVNLAAQAGVRYSIKNPHAYVQSNVVGFLNILECCRSEKTKHLIYASSSSVYGDRSKVPFSENEKVDSPVSLYAATKKSNELMAHSYSHLFNIKTTGLRFFTVYGPWGRPDMAPMLFAHAISNQKPVKIFNNGDMLRDFTFIDDVVEGIVKLVSDKKEEEDEDSRANIFNIGNSKPVKLMDFISGLENEMDQEAIKVFLPMQDGDVKVTYSDSSKLKQAIGYAPSTTLKTGLTEFVSWYSSFYSK